MFDQFVKEMTPKALTRHPSVQNKLALVDPKTQKPMLSKIEREKKKEEMKKLENPYYEARKAIDELITEDLLLKNITQIEISKKIKKETMMADKINKNKKNKLNSKKQEKITSIIKEMNAINNNNSNINNINNINNNQNIAINDISLFDKYMDIATKLDGKDTKTEINDKIQLFDKFEMQDTVLFFVFFFFCNFLFFCFLRTKTECFSKLAIPQFCLYFFVKFKIKIQTFDLLMTP